MHIEFNPAMKIYFEILDKELKSILKFWTRNVIDIQTKVIYGECDINGRANPDSPLGSMYLARIMYGMSAACRHYKSSEYKPYADLAYTKLVQEYKNPNGGYFWSIDSSGNREFDTENVCMAQAFILYGLTEYALLSDSPEIEQEINSHLEFIDKTLRDQDGVGYIDGFTEEWRLTQYNSRALATHIHLLESFVKLFEYKPGDDLKNRIRELIEIITSYFIDEEKQECLHRLTKDWKKLPNFNWAGHNAEIGWILCQAAETIDNKDLITVSKELLSSLLNNLLAVARDETYGGIFNELVENVPIEDFKLWWPQAETALALLYHYKHFGDDESLKKALMLIGYIDDIFVDKENDEWFAMVSKVGDPLIEEAKVHFWKSMYHNVRYCILTTKLLKTISR